MFLCVGCSGLFCLFPLILHSISKSDIFEHQKYNFLTNIQISYKNSFLCKPLYLLTFLKYF